MGDLNKRNEINVVEMLTTGSICSALIVNHKSVGSSQRYEELLSSRRNGQVKRIKKGKAAYIFLCLQPNINIHSETWAMNISRKI
jgi:hypothetical protein